MIMINEANTLDLDDLDDIQEEFSRFALTNEVALMNTGYLFFNDYELDLDDLVDRKDSFTEFVMLYDHQVYFLVSIKDSGLFNFSIALYRCNVDGSSLEKCFEKGDIFTRNLKAFESNDTIYVEYQTDGTSKVDSYDLKNRMYTLLGNSEDIDLESLKKDVSGLYEVEKQDNSIILTETETQKTQTIDENFLKNTEYFDALKKFDYKFFRCFVENDRIFLLYILDSGAPFEYSFAVFEYDFSNHKLIFKSTHSPHDIDGLSILYF